MPKNSVYGILQDLPTNEWTTGDIFALNDDEYLSLPRSIGSQFLKYSISKDSWSGPHRLEGIDGDTFVDDAAVDKANHSMIIMTGASRIHTVDTKQMIKKSESGSSPSTIDVLSGCRPRMLVVGDHIHCIGTDVHRSHSHYIFNKLTRHLVTGPTPIPNDLHWVHRMLFLKLRNSIIAFGESPEQRAKIFEYSLDSKQWTVWEWIDAPGTYWPAIVCTHDGRYIMCCGGRRWGESNGFDSEWKGQIIVYDVVEEKFVESALKCPVGSRYHAAMMCSECRDKLLAFGFVRKFSPEMVPNHLAALMSKWICIEHVHLIADEYWSRKRGHWRINVDDILQSVL